MHLGEGLKRGGHTPEGQNLLYSSSGFLFLFEGTSPATIFWCKARIEAAIADWVLSSISENMHIISTSSRSSLPSVFANTAAVSAASCSALREGRGRFNMHTFVALKDLLRSFFQCANSVDKYWER